MENQLFHQLNKKMQQSFSQVEKKWLPKKIKLCIDCDKRE